MRNSVKGRYQSRFHSITSQHQRKSNSLSRQCDLIHRRSRQKTNTNHQETSFNNFRSVNRSRSSNSQSMSNKSLLTNHHLILGPVCRMMAWRRNVIGHRTLSPTSKIAVGISRPVNAKSPSECSSIRNQHPWLLRLNVHQPTWEPIHCVDSFLRKKSETGLTNSNEPKSGVLSRREKDRSAIERERERESSNAVFRAEEE
jgi:hypothetical protein